MADFGGVRRPHFRSPRYPCDGPGQSGCSSCLFEHRARRGSPGRTGARHVQEQLLRDARDLLSAGGPFSPALLQLKDRLGAELLAGSYEEVAIEEAAVLEARLGPWHRHWSSMIPLRQLVPLSTGQRN